MKQKKCILCEWGMSYRTVRTSRWDGEMRVSPRKHLLVITGEEPGQLRYDIGFCPLCGKKLSNQSSHEIIYPCWCEKEYIDCGSGETERIRTSNFCPPFGTLVRVGGTIMALPLNDFDQKNNGYEFLVNYCPTCGKPLKK